MRGIICVSPATIRTPKIARLVKAATGRIASYTRRALTPASYALDLWRFPYIVTDESSSDVAAPRGDCDQSAAGGGVFDMLDPGAVS